ncbi:acyltransferase family protein [Agromyces salentinus]|uniref:Acyltransferase n=1 Tax=Agromyces salentinus TaxID=269421 RepID=A0ABP4Z9M3_9MICO|nr:acyltransferase [Agromyces salentinus]
MPRLNNFDAMRIAAALAVIVGHGFELTGAGAAPRVLGVPIHVLGVQVFFVMSGFLITTSWLRTPSPLAFFRNRALRIFPGLVVVVLLTVFVLGPLVTTLSVPQYFAEPRTWRYLQNILLWPQFDLPGVFLNVPHPGSVNGSLWTLPVEFACYIAVPVLLAFTRWRFAAVIAFAVAGVLIDQFILNPLIVWGTSLQKGADLFTFFAAGMLVALLGRRVLRLDIAIAALAAQVLIAAAFNPIVSRWALWVTLSYVVLAFCMTSTPYLRRAARFGDLSYGLYIYAFPIQQLTVSAWPGLPFVANLLVVITLTAGAAFASWHLVEKHALRLKARPRSRTIAPLPAEGAAASMDHAH